MSNANSGKNSLEIKVITEFGNISLSRDSKTSVRLLNINGKKYVDIRKQWRPEDQEEFIFTKKGIMLSYDSILELEKMMTKVKEGLKAA